MSLVIRPADATDVEPVVGVFLGCWTESYRGVLPDDDIDRWDADRARSYWQAHLASSRLTVVEVDGRVSGVVRYEAEGSLGHVHSLYIEPSSAGLGLGRRLVDSALTDLTHAGCDRVVLWVFTLNTAAQAFYRRLGFTDDGRRTHDPDYRSELMGMAKDIASPGGT